MTYTSVLSGECIYRRRVVIGQRYIFLDGIVREGLPSV